MVVVLKYGNFKKLNLFKELVLINKIRFILYFLYKLYLGFFSKFWYEFELIGFQYFLKKSSKRSHVEIDIGYSFNLMLKFSKTFKLRKKKKRIFIFDLDFFIIKRVETLLMNLHVFPYYKVKGFIYKEQKMRRGGYFNIKFLKPKKQKILETFFLTAKYRQRFF